MVRGHDHDGAGQHALPAAVGHRLRAAEFGPDPVSEKNIVVKEGRFGPYITDGVTNITVPRSTSLEELTRERAIELLAEKRAKGPVKRTTRKAPARKAAAKK